MNRSSSEFYDNQAILTFEVSDEALEAAASPRAGAAMSLLNAPTVSIVFSCCGDNAPSAAA